MPTRTAPLFTASATGRSITLGLIDASGDLYSEQIDVAIAAAAADIETWAAAYAAGSNASLYSITDTQERIGTALASNATVAYRASAAEGINMLFDNVTEGTSFTGRLVAPVVATMSGNTDTPLPLVTPLSTLLTAYQALLTGFVAASVQFTGRRERKNNTRVKL